MTTKTKTEPQELDFSHFTAELETAECPVTKIRYKDESFPVLTVEHADLETNDKLKEWVRKKQMGKRAPIKNSRDEQEAYFNEILKEAYAAVIIKGWSNVLTRDGQSIDFTPNNALQFLKALHHVQWREIRDFCTKSANFGDVADVDTKIKN